MARSARPPSAPWTQFRLLLSRAWRQVVRAKGVLVIKAVQQVMIALIYGSIYKLDLSQRSVQDRLGLLSLIAVGASNLAIAGTIRSFPKEKVLVFEERAKRLYSVVAYVRAPVARARARCARVQSADAALRATARTRVPPGAAPGRPGG